MLCCVLLFRPNLRFFCPFLRVALSGAGFSSSNDFFPIQQAGGVSFVVFWFLVSFYVGFVLLVCLCSLAYAADLTAYIMACDSGTPEMNVIADAIREGSEGFLLTQYGTVGQWSGVVAGALFVIYLIRPKQNLKQKARPVAKHHETRIEK